MKLLGLSKTSRRWWLAAACFALIAMSFATAQAMERALTNKDIERWLPRLRAEAAAFTKEVREGRELGSAMASAMETREVLFADMASGKTNIAEWMRSHTNYALVPAGAVYCDKCSQALVYEYAMPTAIYTFEKESPHRDLLRRAATGDETARDEFNKRRGEEEVKGRSAAEQAMNDFVAEVVAFYRDRGFIEAEGDRPITVTFLHSPDTLVLVTIWEANPYCGLLPRNVIAPCAALPTGPLVELQFEGNLLNLPPEAKPGEEAATAPAIEETMDGAEAPAGREQPPAGDKPDTDYERVKEALFLARLDAANPSQLEIEIPPDAPAEVKAELGALAAEFTVRKANMLVYKRHEAELAPLLKALQEF